jgi:hypothetical protein
MIGPLASVDVIMMSFGVMVVEKNRQSLSPRGDEDESIPNAVRIPLIDRDPPYHAFLDRAIRTDLLSSKQQKGLHSQALNLYISSIIIYVKTVRFILNEA